MIESVETVKDVEKQLGEARTKLQAFEGGVDRGRLLLRLKLASPAHPVLLFRGFFLFLTVLMMGGALAILIVPFVNGDLARQIAKFDAVVPVPAGVPGLPALLGGLALLMFVGWAMTTMAALSMGRDAQMLPWEQKQHQKLVNEVTRLTTQKAVMERMRSTPAGARPRIETPVPVSLRDRQGMATPSALGRLGDRNQPPSLGRMTPGRFGGAPGGGGEATSNPFGRAPSSAPASDPGGGAGMFGRAAASTPPGAATQPQGGAFSAPATGGGGVLARARSGALKTTPAGAAGRLTPNFNRPDGGGPPADKEGSDDAGPFGGSGGLAARAAGAPASSNPFARKAPQAAETPLGVNPFAGNAPSASGSAFSQPSGGTFGGGGGNPFGANRPNVGQKVNLQFGAPAVSEDDVELEIETGPSVSVAMPSPSLSTAPRVSIGMSPGRGMFGTPPPSDERDDALPDIVESRSAYSASHNAIEPEANEDDPTVIGTNHKAPLPRWGAISDPWLEESLERVEELSATLPLQAHMRFSEETHLPFTLVISRATPAVAVKALVSFVDFLGAIPTPPRARIELNASPGLDRSFHRNVEAALQPIYGEDFEVDLEPGRVEVVFKQPDVAWQDYPVLPTV